MNNRPPKDDSSRRTFIKSMGIAGLGALTLSGTSKAEKSQRETEQKPPQKESNQDSSQDEMDEETRQKLQDELDRLDQVISNSIKKTHAEKAMSPSPLALVGSIPSIGEGGSFGVQEANWEAGDANFNVYPAFAEYDTVTSGVTNQAFAGSYLNYAGADNPTAWAETGLKFDCDDSGRYGFSSQGWYAGELAAGGSAAADIGFNIHLIDETEGEEVGKLQIWNAGSLIVPIPGQTKDESYMISGEFDLVEGHRYLLACRVTTSAAVIGTGSARSNAWTGRWTFDGKFQWNNLSAWWVGPA